MAPRRAALESVERVLDPNVLTIGFARRFATYKRAALLFSDEERLARLLWNEERPVQVVFAGKAHPADRPGQRVIRDIFERTQAPRLAGRAFILEDYDMRIARYLVQGVDVWLNNPRRPLEASGTSGMKAAANGIVNVSVLDGWWDEGWNGTNGWAIGGRETLDDEEAQDAADAADLYRILEEEVVPRWYERDAKGLPPAWVELDEGVHRLDHLALLDDAHARGVRRAALPAGGPLERAPDGRPGHLPRRDSELPPPTEPVPGRRAGPGSPASSGLDEDRRRLRPAADQSDSPARSATRAPRLARRARRAPAMAADAVLAPSRRATDAAEVVERTSCATRAGVDRHERPLALGRSLEHDRLADRADHARPRPGGARHASWRAAAERGHARHAAPGRRRRARPDTSAGSRGRGGPPWRSRRRSRCTALPAGSAAA